MGVILFAGRWPGLTAQQRPISGLFVSAASPGAARPTDATTIRSREVTIDFGQLSETSPSLLLNLFEDATYTAVPDRIDRTTHGFVWVGHVQGVEAATVTLAVDDGVMHGSIRIPPASYAVRFSGGGVYAIVQLNEPAFPREAPPRKVPR